MTRPVRIEETTTLLKRLEVLERLCESPAHVRDLVEDTDHSRRTINRAVSELEDQNFLERGEEGVQVTMAGRLARDRLEAFLVELDDVLLADAVLEPIPANADVAPDIVAGGEPVLASGPAAYRPLERLHGALREADRYRALVPTIEDVRHVRLLYEHVVTEENPAELVVTPDVFEALCEAFPRRIAAMAEAEGFSVFVGETPPFFLCRFDRDGRPGTAPTSVVHLLVLNESGSVHGSIVNDTEAALEWADERYAACRSGATDRTDELRDGGEAGRDGSHSGTLEPATGRDMPVSVAREGFVRIDGSFFEDRPVADPITAWRAGLSLAEVHVGYAVSRPSSTSEEGAAVDRADVTPETDAHTDDDRGDRDDERSLAATLVTELAASTDCVVLGPPGSGKSTVCKRVACRWYEGGRGPVYYRERDRGRSFAAVDELVDAVTGADGHALVVVEDAVRPHADAIFEVIDRVRDHDDVSVLLDAREHEWHDAQRQSLATTDPSIHHVPSMTEADCRRVVEHFERTADRSVDVPAADLWEAVQSDGTGAVGGTNELYRLIHRLATYADPLDSAPTALEEAVARTYEEVAPDDLTLEVTLLVNALILANVRLDREVLRAAVAPAEQEAVDRAIERLEGTVLFPHADGHYRTVHEEWATAFLSHVLETDSSGDVPARFGRVVSGLLSLADDVERRDSLDVDADESTLPATATESPTRWADDLTERLYGIVRERSQLAPLFGDGDWDSVTLPDCASADVERRRPIWLGEAFLRGDYYDEARRAFERVPSDEVELTAERLLGLARVSIATSEYEAAVERCETCLETVDDRDLPLVRARARYRLGEARTEQGSFDDAETALEAALETVRAEGARTWEARILRQLAKVALESGSYETASRRYESALELFLAEGDRRGEADASYGLGKALGDTGDFDGAVERYERSLHRRRQLGDRAGVVACLLGLGWIAWRRDEYDRADRLFRRGRRIAEEIENEALEVAAVNNLAVLAGEREELERARDLFDRSRQLCARLGKQHLEAKALYNLGEIDRMRGKLASAREQFERTLELRRELGDVAGEANALNSLGEIDTLQGRCERASCRLERALDLLESIGRTPFVGTSANNLARLAIREGALEEASDRLGWVDGIDQSATSAKTICETHRLRAELAIRRNQYDRARDHLEVAIEMLATVEGEAGAESAALELTRARLALQRGELDRARHHGTAACEGFEAAGTPHWIGRSERLLGRVAMASDEPDRAREHLLQATDRFAEMEAFEEAAITMEVLADLAETDDRSTEALEERRRLLERAPEEVRERHASVWS